MHGHLLVLTLVAATASCATDKKTAPAPGSEPARPPAPMPVDGGATRDAGATQDAGSASALHTGPSVVAEHIVVPPGPIRLRAATVSEAAQLVAELFGINTIVLEDPKRASFALDQGAAAKTLGALARQFGYAHRQHKSLHLLAPAERAGVWTGLRKGVKIDLSFNAAAGNNLIRLLAEVGGARLEGGLGGFFSTHLRRMDSNIVSQAVALACGATLTLNKGVMTFAGSQCDSALEPPEPYDPDVEDADMLPLWREQLALATLEVQEKSPRLRGVAVIGKRRAAILGDDEGASTALQQGAFFGAVGSHCQDWYRANNEALGSGAGDQEHEDYETQRMNAKTIDELKALDARLQKRLALLAKVEQELMKTKPSWCLAAHGPDAGEILWRLDAVDSDGVTLMPVLISPEDGFDRPMVVTEWTQDFPEGLGPRRLAISD